MSGENQVSSNDESLSFGDRLEEGAVVANELGISDPLVALELESQLVTADADRQVRERSIAIADKIGGKEFTIGRSPSALAAAVIYVAISTLDRSITQEQVAANAGCSTVTIRNNYREVQEVWMGQ